LFNFKNMLFVFFFLCVCSLQSDLLRPIGLRLPTESGSTEIDGNISDPSVALLVQFHRPRRSPRRQSTGKCTSAVSNHRLTAYSVQYIIVTTTSTTTTTSEWTPVRWSHVKSNIHPPLLRDSSSCSSYSFSSPILFPDVVAECLSV
jgi:hypothetical protein